MMTRKGMGDSKERKPKPPSEAMEEPANEEGLLSSALKLEKPKARRRITKAFSLDSMIAESFLH
jgi:hypothetical protein